MSQETRPEFKGVLIVDDDEDIRIEVADLFQAHGAKPEQIHQVGSPEEAQVLVQDQNIDINALWVDEKFNRRNSDGISLIEQVLKRSSHAADRIVMVSADEESAFRAEGLGIPFVNKLTGDINKTIEMLMGRSEDQAA